MKKAKKFFVSALALLLSALTLLPAETASALTDQSQSSKDSGVYWSSTLPTNGDGKYTSDEYWHRLVLEYGKYSTLACDSEGAYVANSAGKSTCWPEKAWGGDAFHRLGNYTYGPFSDYWPTQPTSWPGQNSFETCRYGTYIYTATSAEYRNQEYSEDGLYSLYIKWAGKSHDGKDCWYISPCDANGNREKKLWAVECCMDLIGDYRTYLPCAKSIQDGIYPDFTLLTPSFKEFEGSENFQYAGVVLPFQAASKDISKISLKYTDNHKWIITQNKDGSWAIRSAGYLGEWNWAEPGGLLDKLFEENQMEVLQNALAHYARVTARQMYQYHLDVNPKEKVHSIVTQYYDAVYADELISYEDDIFGCSYEAQIMEDNVEYKEKSLLWWGEFARAIPFIPILFLNEYCENVYITGGYQQRVSFLRHDNGNNAFTGGTDYHPVECRPNKLYLSYGMELKNDVSRDAVQHLYNQSLLNYKNRNKLVSRYWMEWDEFHHPATEWAGHMKITVSKTTQKITGESVTTPMTTAEIRENLLFRYVSNYVPGQGTGAFSGLYVGKPLDMYTLSEKESSYTVAKNELAVLGRADGNGDGVCEGMGIIGTLAEHSYRSGSSAAAPTITIEAGGAMQINGPTYAAVGTTINVKGSLVIGSGASLSPEMYAGGRKRGYGLTINILGGSVLISSGAVLDLGCGNLTISGGGGLVNNGVLAQASSCGVGVYSQIRFSGGTLENSSTGWLVCTGEVTQRRFQSLLREVAKPNTTVGTLLPYFTPYSDDVVEKYTQYPFETSKNTGYVHMTFSSKNGSNLLRNAGTAILPGAIKGIEKSAESSYAGYICNGGTFYRLDTLYSTYSSNRLLFPFSSIKKILSAAGTTIQKDPTIQRYLAYTDLYYVESYIVRDMEKETKALQENLLALRVGTGSQGTDRISSFFITYVGEDNAEYTETVSTGSLAKTYEYVSNWAYCGTAENEKGDSKLVKGSENAAMSKDKSPSSLQPLSTVTYLFQSLVPVSYIKSISFAGTGSSSWTCTELNVYRVSYLYPLQEYGYRSEQWYVPFSGTLLAEAALSTDSSGVRNKSFNWEDEYIEIGTETGSTPLIVYDVPDEISSATNSKGFTYYSVLHESVPYETRNPKYAFSVSLADSNDGGIEAFYFPGTNQSLRSIMSNAALLKKLREEVTLEMQLVYLDTLGSVHSVVLPVTRNAVEYAYSYSGNDAAAALHGLFQQGEEIAFGGTLPDYKRGLEVTLRYKDSTAGASILITSIGIYQSGYVSAEVKNGILRTSYEANALDYYAAPSAGGVRIDKGASMSISLKSWNGSDALKPKASGSKYLVVVDTDTMSEAGTDRNIEASFRYQTVTGVSTNTATYSLMTLSKDYFGYWLDAEGKNANCSYLSMVSPGGTLYFVLTLSNVYQFESATFTLSKKDLTSGKEVSETTASTTSTTAHDWQMKGITIYELEELGQRQVILGQAKNYGAFSSNRIYYRDNILGKRGIINKYSGAMMLTPGESKTVTFEAGGGSVGGGGSGGSGGLTNPNKATDVTNLSYEETKQDFGFDTRRVMYTVTVKVAGDAVNSVEDGDCGSKNQFYFQLVFQDEDGKLRTSPCVLSNQQLKSDGFRTGQKETFNIFTNDDYGTPVQINVIPDDTSSTSDVFDKLKIEYISVSRTSGTGVNLSWQTEKDAVGWIDIEYKDDLEEQNGRSNEELVRSFALREQGYQVWLEFGITTNSEYVDNRQFVGKVTADIVYLDSNGMQQTLPSLDVVEAIATYANRISEITSVSSAGTATSVDDYMFTKGYTNRFRVSFNDISSLVRMRVKITQTSGSLKIDKVFARQVYGEGQLNYNVYNEYEREYSVKPQDLTTSDNTGPITIKNGIVTTISFNSGNSIQVKESEEEEAEVEVIKAQSEGQNDQLCMILELEDTSGIPDGAALPAKISYKNIYGDAYAVSTDLVFDAASGMFMIPLANLAKTADIAVPYQLEIGSGGYGGKRITAATVYQIRKEEVYESFVFAPGTETRLKDGENAVLLLTESDIDEYAKRKGYTEFDENIYLELGNTTARSLLSAAQDVQFALVYTELNDPYAFLHTSDYVSAMDLGYTILESGMILKIPMSVPNVGSVKSVLIRKTGDALSLNIARGCISIEQTSVLTGATLATGWVNLPTATGAVTTTGTEMNSDGTSLQAAFTSTSRIAPFEFSAQVASVARNDAYLRLAVCYKTQTNGYEKLSCTKPASEWDGSSPWYLSSSPKTILYYTIEVYDNDPTNVASVTLGSLKLGYYNESGAYTTLVYDGDKTITEGNTKGIPLVASSLSGSIQNYLGGELASLGNNLVTPGRTDYDVINFNDSRGICLSASLPDYPGQLQATVVNTATNEPLTSTFSAAENSTTLSFSWLNLPPDINKETIYCITVWAKDFEQYKSTIYVKLPFAKAFECLVYVDNSLLQTLTLIENNTQYVSFTSIHLYYPSEIRFYYRRINGTGSTELLSFTEALADDPFTESHETGVTLAGYEGVWNLFTIKSKPVTEPAGGIVFCEDEAYNDCPYFFFDVFPKKQ